ncbi:MAG: MFS transporter [Polyangiales bacterium]
MALALASALSPLNSTMIAVAIPAIAKDLGTPVSALTHALVTSYLLVGIVFQSPAGKMGDRLGHARVLMIGQVVFAVGSTIGFLSRSTLGLSFARVLMATGGAFIVPAAMALVRLHLPQEKRAQAYGAFGALMGLSAAIGPVLGGEITRRIGWPAVFLVNAPVLIASAFLARGEVSDAPKKAARFDVVGSVLLGASLAAIVIATKSHGWLAIPGILGLFAFFAWELRVADPVVDPHLFRAPPFASGAAVVALQNFAMYALLFELPSYMSSSAQIDAGRAGRTLFAMMGAMVVGSPLGGRLAARWSARTVVGLGSATATLGMLSLLLVPAGKTLLLVPSLIALGLGLGLSTAPSQASALSSVAAEKSGMAAAAMSTSRYLGGVAGVATLAAILAHGTAASQHPTAVRVFGTALALSFLASRLLPRSA